MIRLVQETAAMLEALEAPEAFRARFGADVGLHAETAKEVVKQTLDFQRKIGATSPWVGYLTADEGSRTIVGCCGFKGNPTDEATVEIAYFTFPDFEGRGLATAMAEELVGIAAGSPQVRAVVAHTLPERNASCRVLEKVGFTLAGEVEDPEDGTVWRWRKELGS